MPLPSCSACATSSRFKWFSMPEALATLSKSTVPSGAMRVMRSVERICSGAM